MATESGAAASERSIHRNARRLRRLADRHGIPGLACGGDGMLVATGGELTHFVAVGFARDAAALLGGPVELVCAATVTGRRVPDAVARPHPL